MMYHKLEGGGGRKNMYLILFWGGLFSIQLVGYTVCFSCYSDSYQFDDRSSYPSFYWVVRYSVENAYLDEKEDTCCAMGELATNCKGSFMPFLNECFKEVSRALPLSCDP